MESFENFRKLLLDNFNEEINEYKNELEDVEDKILKSTIEKQEIMKKVIELQKSNDGSHDVFSPIGQNEDFNLIEIEKLTEKSSRVEEEIVCHLQSKETLKDKIRNKQNVLKIVEEFELTHDKIHNTNIVGLYIDKLKFCSKICISDSNRCKVELDNIIKKLSNDKNISRETFEN